MSSDFMPKACNVSLLCSTVNGGDTSPKPKLTPEAARERHQQPILKDLAARSEILINFAGLL